MIGPIPVDLEGFSITMATVFNFSKNDHRVMFLPVFSFPLMYDSPKSDQKPEEMLIKHSRIQRFPFLSINGIRVCCVNKGRGQKL